MDPIQLTVKSALNSLWRVKVISLQHNDQREGEAQKRYGINSKPKKVEIQFNDKLKILEAGSKIENKLAIIFKWVEV